MVPVWPFVHLQDEGLLALHSPGVFINPMQHRMIEYVNSVGNKDWKTLERYYQSKVSDPVLEQWLSSNSAASLTANTLNLFSQAIGYVIRKVLKAVAITFQTVITQSVTLLDQLTYILHKGISETKVASEWVVKLISKMARSLGIAVRKGKDITLTFIRFVLNSMMNYVRQLVQKSTDFISG
jgi:hypothetical protein